MGEIMADAAEVVPGAIENKLDVISFDEIARLDIIAEDRFGSQLEFDSNNFDPFKACSCI
jgi:hypothetical protein